MTKTRMIRLSADTISRIRVTREGKESFDATIRRLLKFPVMDISERYDPRYRIFLTAELGGEFSVPYELGEDARPVPGQWNMYQAVHRIQRKTGRQFAPQATEDAWNQHYLRIK
jgi:hypothetical protein